jgi:hypothetical protein
MISLRENLSALPMDEFTLKINGHSMSPLIKEGDELFLTTKYQLKNSDIILFKDRNGEYITHRVIDLENSISKGDFSTCSERFKKEEVLGVVESFKRRERIKKLDGFFLNQIFLYLSKNRLKNKVVSRLSLYLMYCFSRFI